MVRLEGIPAGILGNEPLRPLRRRAYPVAMPNPQTVWTVELLHEIPEDGNRYEIIDGVLLVSPSPAPVHQSAIGELYLLLKPYAASLGFSVFFAPASVTWSPDTEVQPDLMVIPREPGRRIERFEEVHHLQLAVEVLSPSSLRADRFTKRRAYQRYGVAEYWIIDTSGRSIERWQPNDEEPEILLESLSWQPHVDAAPLVIDLVKYFRDVHEE